MKHNPIIDLLLIMTTDCCNFLKAMRRYIEITHSVVSERYDVHPAFKFFDYKDGFPLPQKKPLGGLELLDEEIRLRCLIPPPPYHVPLVQPCPDGYKVPNKEWHPKPVPIIPPVFVPQPVPVPITPTPQPPVRPWWMRWPAAIPKVPVFPLPVVPIFVIPPGLLDELERKRNRWNPDGYTSMA